MKIPNNIKELEELLSAVTVTPNCLEEIAESSSPKVSIDDRGGRGFAGYLWETKVGLTLKKEELSVTLTKEQVQHIISVGIDIGSNDGYHSEDEVLDMVMDGMTDLIRLV